ncbi:MAG: DNA mismatch repair endonuclease MutL [Lachnospiraceae bacterium]|nr:DNA mismatch repair endonuclease MutL [Lachnospiraceae bacterium]
MIRVLNKETIDRISAGEVVERPVNVVKELVENAIDSGAGAITVEIKGGGIDLIRVTDNGCGIASDEMKTAFMRHATSKIDKADDLDSIVTLGFRGEALASICAVSETEMISCVQGALTGNKLYIRGGEEISFDEIGAPSGTTVIVRNLFFNTPARKKFLKTASTEGSYIGEMMEKIALSHPDIAFQFTADGRSRFHTSGSGDLLEVIYRVYGKETADALVPVKAENDMFRIEGYLGKPEMVRSNRNMEIYFINGRYVRNTFMSSAVEEGYREYLMLHKFPVVFLNFETDPFCVDVNVHPAKLDVRISDQNAFFVFVSSSIHDVMTAAEMIPENILTTDAEKKEMAKASAAEVHSGKNPEPFEMKRSAAENIQGTLRAFNRASGYDMGVTSVNAGQVAEDGFYKSVKAAPDKSASDDFFESPGRSSASDDDFFEDETMPASDSRTHQNAPAMTDHQDSVYAEDADSSDEDHGSGLAPDPASEYLEGAVLRQKSLFDDHLLEKDKRASYRIIGQVFDTYWIVQYEDKMFIIDQHAAHEKVNYERFVKRIRNDEHPTQMLVPPVIVSLTSSEEQVFLDNKESFEKIGFEVESFGGNEYALRGVPTDLFGHSEREMFLAVLDEMASNPGLGSFRTIDEKIAGMACKASVKGGDRIGYEQAEKLIDELLLLDNPYNCPHGRPTIISISKTEMEKKFKRIVD